MLPLAKSMPRTEPSPLKLPADEERQGQQHHQKSKNTMSIMSMVVEPDYFPCVKHAKHFFAPDLRHKSKGGKALSYVRRPLAVSEDVYVAMLNSSSDGAWAPYIRPTNIALIEVVEGKVPVVLYEVEGYEEITRQTFLIPPFDVLARHMPKLLDEATKDALSAGVPVDEEDEPSSKKRAANVERMKALEWTPNDCALDKGKGKRPCRPNPQTNNWLQLPSDRAIELASALKPLYDRAKATRPTIGKASNKRAASGSSAGAGAAPAATADMKFAAPNELFPGEKARTFLRGYTPENTSFEFNEEGLVMTQKTNKKAKTASVEVPVSGDASVMDPVDEEEEGEEEE
jgi:hypothetical protein